MQQTRINWDHIKIVIVMTAIVLFLGWVQKSPCMSGYWINQIQYRQYCHTDVVSLYHADGLSKGKIPYIEQRVEYPVLTGIFMGVVGLPVHALGEKFGPEFNQTLVFYNICALVLSIFALYSAYILLLMRSFRPLDVLFFSMSPFLIFSGTVNWDMLCILPAVAALYAWSKNKHILSGFLLGLAIALKFWPLLIIGPLVLLAIRTGKIKEVLKAVATTVITWLVINLPFAIFFHDGWYEFFRLNSTRNIDWGTIWYIFRYFDIFPFITHFVSMVNLYYIFFFFVCCIGIAFISLQAPKKPRLAQLSFLVVACFLMTGKVWSQQFVLWLLPLAVLVRPRPSFFIAWQIGELFYFIAFYKELLNTAGHSVMPEWVFIAASLARLITLLALCISIVWDIYHPKNDPVRDSKQDDPDGGVFNNAPDARYIR